MNRILVVGISGTGKTYAAERLAQKFNLPVTYLDSIFWKENWKEEDEALVKSKIKKLINANEWVIEGYIEPLGKERVQQAELVIYLDYSGISAVLGGLDRRKQFRGKVRPEMPAGNTESVGIKFLWTLFMRHERPEIEKTISGYEQKVVRLKSRKQTESYLQHLVV
jgi:adenylate kinase family enzyme